ncbi:hypothetical protein KUG85_02935 [Nitratireductor sp. L1-7-SE]|uniref:DUF1570 domain-containing protein n=1 Tax=Nitratireductor rhodophyticola TaxID=2854036 RepID=A0ABS7R726_9HYPH|nr:hypothetical protein [Nitratireductor rhodophyticola]MBY8915290.1 hypothetical protein [Nitratireductor rhodophyticola]MBY8919641.1 hypothetical protein [Nitratireductor rhodophyticola]
MADIFSEWLRTNRVDDAFLRRNLTDHALPIFLTGAGASGRSMPPETSAEAAWEMAAQALTAGIPELSRLIRFVQTRVPRSFEVQQGRDGRAFTYDRGDRGDRGGRGRKTLPFVSCPYRGTASDILTVAHEFSHALQIVSSGRSTMPPLSREVCAFVGEQLLLGWVRQARPALSPYLETAWLTDNSRYLGTDLQSLKTALESGSDTYDYAWNYPIARLLAQSIGQEWTRKKIAALFRSGEKAPSLLKDYHDRPRILQQRYVLPGMHDADGTVAGLYRQIGGLLLLDLQDMDAGAVDRSIGDRYARLLQSMQDRSVFLALDRQQVPLGYVLWQRDGEGKTVHLEHRIACRQRLPDLLASLESHCPQVAMELRHAKPTDSSWGIRQ